MIFSHSQKLVKNVNVSSPYFSVKCYSLTPSPLVALSSLFTLHLIIFSRCDMLKIFCKAVTLDNIKITLYRIHPHPPTYARTHAHGAIIYIYIVKIYLKKYFKKSLKKCLTYPLRFDNLELPQGHGGSIPSVVL